MEKIEKLIDVTNALIFALKLDGRKDKANAELISEAERVVKDISEFETEGIKIKKSEKTFDELSKVIMSKFDFDKVAEAMRMMDWRWIIADNPDDPWGWVAAVPDIDRIKKEALSLLQQAYDDDESSPYSTDGLHAQYLDGVLSLRCVIEEYDAIQSDYPQMNFPMESK